MGTISSKLTALAIALAMNSLIMGAVGYLFEVQSLPHLSVISFARQLAAHQWFIWGLQVLAARPIPRLKIKSRVFP